MKHGRNHLYQLDKLRHTSTQAPSEGQTRMDLLEFLSNLGSALDGFNTSGQKPRRVFTRGFVVTCVFVAIIELFILNQIYSGHP